MANNEIKGTIALLTLAYQIDDRLNRNAHDFLDLYVSKLGWRKDSESKSSFMERIQSESLKAVQKDQVEEFISENMEKIVKKNDALTKIKKILSIDDAISRTEEVVLSRMTKYATRSNTCEIA